MTSDQIGVTDVMKPDYGDPVEIQEGEIPAFWPCDLGGGGKCQVLPIVITHAPNHIFIADIRNTQFNG